MYIQQIGVLIMYILIGVLLLIMLYFRRIASFTKNPYKLLLIVGSKGSGKSLLQAQIANAHDGDIYSNMGIGEPLPADYWNYRFPPNSLIMIDEVGVIHNNRQFKSFEHKCMEWYKMQRKRRVNVVLSSQALDMDATLQRLCDRIVITERFSIWCIAKSYKAVVAPVKNPEGGEEIANTIKFLGLYKVFAYAAAVRKVEKIGYATEQIISKDDSGRGETDLLFQTSPVREDEWQPQKA